MADYSKAEVCEWWYDAEFNEFVSILKTVEGQYRCITTPKTN